MCGRINVNDDPLVHGLLDALGIRNHNPMIYSRYLSAGDRVAIVLQQEDQRWLQQAIWWLLLEPAEQPVGFKPNSRYFSINTNWQSLGDPTKAGYQPYRHSRCAIVVSGFGESQDKIYHNLYGKNDALMLGGLYKTWLNESSGELLYSCSVITLAGHPRLASIHRKASPLMLPMQSQWIDAWLDPDFHDVAYFKPLLTPSIRSDLVVQQVDRPSTAQPVAEPFMLYKDD